MSSNPQYPHPGISRRRNQHGIEILRLHYEADPAKGGGEKVLVPEINRWLSPWALGEYRKMTDPAMYLQEYEIDAEARLGALLYQLDEAATLEDSFPIPPDWTRYMALDPHPRVPHAFLWCAVDRWGDRWYYRELWPSRAAFRYQGKQLLGVAGPSPQDDNRFKIPEYVETLQYLESAENPENAEKAESIYKRTIDYTARAFGKGTADDPEQPNYQQRYELHMLKMGMSRPFFDDAKKDHEVGVETCNEGLKPIEVMGSDGAYVRRSRIHIFRDKCPELIWELKNCRFEQLTPRQVEHEDPSGEPVEVRKHLCDDFRYIEMAHPVYVRPDTAGSTWEPRVPGIAY